MNYGNYHFGGLVKKSLSDMLFDRRMPHSVIISGGSSELRERTADYLCTYAVCTSDEKPCFLCNGCHKASEHIHPDIEYAKGDADSKKGIYSKKVLESVQEKIGIRTNESPIRVFVFKDVDEKLPPISQNSLLKTLEEPPSDILFILTCKNACSLLETVLSRCTEIALPCEDEFSQESRKISEEIAKSIIDVREYALLSSTYKLNNRTSALQVLLSLRELMRECLLCSVGESVNNPLCSELIRKLTKEKILGIINTLNSAQKKLDSNVNMNLFCVWLCAEFRRITWQK